MIKAIFFDLDGTLLNSKKEITAQTKQTLMACKANGVKLFIATARPPLLDKMLSWDNETLSLFDGGSYYNGGCVIIGDNKGYVPVSEEIVSGAVNLVSECDEINISLQLEDERHAFRYPLDSSGYKTWGVTLEDSLDLIDAQAYKTIKILVFYSNLVDFVKPIEENLVRALKSICRDKAQLYLTDKGKVIQIMGFSVNKYQSIEKIRLSLSLEKEEIAVFGDDVNDIAMLSAYKYSVAMGNAESHVKQIANYITLDNNSEGIAYAVCKLLKLV
jgi:Cof subfamily protein (haloacid dehalogenase superfamily)